MQNGNDSLRTRRPENPDFPLGDDNVVQPDAADVQHRLADTSDIDSSDIGGVFGPYGIKKPAPPSHRQWVFIGVFLLMTIAMIATGLVVTSANEKRTSTLSALHARLEESTSGRRDILRTWINRWVLASKRLTSSEVVRIFTSDMALNPAGTPLPRSLLDQRPYFQTLMADFAEQNDLTRAAVIDGNGRLLLSSSGPILDIASILEKVGDAPKGWKRIISPIRSLGSNRDDLVIDVLVPMPMVQVTDKNASDEVAIFVQTVPAVSVLTDLLAVPSTRKETEKIYLVQEGDNSLEQITLAASDVVALGPAQIDRVSNEQQLTPNQPSMIDGRLHFSSWKSVPGASWAIVHAVEAGAALAVVKRFVFVITGIAIAIVLGASLCFAAFWWRRTSAHHQEQMLLYQAFADRLDQQRRFLNAITTSISDWLAVLNAENRYIHVNPAFAAVLGLPKSEIIGRYAEDVLPMERFTPPGDALSGLVASEQVSVLHLGDRQHLIATSWSDLLDQTGRSVGKVAVMQDQTELVEQRQKRIRSLTETVDAFVHTVERRDSFLLGHTRRLRSYAIAVGRKLSLDEKNLTGIALAASLSQIGKIFIPDEILVKPKRHSQHEVEVMRSHIDHALNILGRIDFGFPVVDILGQMHERLDGSGYPNGLSGNEIDLPGRILGAVDVFCARTAPRSYRDRLSAGNALFHLANNASRYDVKVIAAVAEVVAREGELDPDDFNEDFLDTQIWEKVSGQQRTVGVGDHCVSANVKLPHC